MTSPRDLVLTSRGLRFAGRFWPCTIGRGGRSPNKREGDGATPTGDHRIVGMLYRPDRMLRPTPWAKPIRPGDLWSDDPTDSEYNQPVRAPYLGSHENLRRPDPLYDVVILLNWNHPDAKPGLGSAIFMHQWRRPGFPTEGCIALCRRDIHQISRTVSYGARVIVR